MVFFFRGEGVYVHYKCPACREVVGGNRLALTDERLTKDDILTVLKTTREQHIKAVRDFSGGLAELVTGAFGELL